MQDRYTYNHFPVKETPSLIYKKVENRKKIHRRNKQSEISIPINKDGLLDWKIKENTENFIDMLK